MTVSTNKKEFLTAQLTSFFAALKADTEPSFGLMTPQHMVEHLIVTLKTTMKRYGEPENPPTKGQEGFKRFIAKGAVFKHRPSDKTKADLPELKYATLEEAVAKIPEAVERFYSHFEANPAYKAYTPFTGELDFAELELFHYQHFRYHLWQFGVLESYD